MIKVYYTNVVIPQPEETNRRVAEGMDENEVAEQTAVEQTAAGEVMDENGAGMDVKAFQVLSPLAPAHQTISSPGPQSPYGAANFPPSP